MSTVIICGDIHGKWGYLNELINKKSPDIILQCGDFGYWPRWNGIPSKELDIFGIKNGNTRIYWADGNHEDHDSLDLLNGAEIHPNVYHMRRGSVLKLPTDEQVLFFGGAKSIDKEWRTEGKDWFKQEEISDKDMINLPECRIDIVVSHTVPNSFLKKSGWNKYVEYNSKYRDSSTFALQILLEKYRPKRWFSGHFHKFLIEKVDGCEWVSLGHAGGDERWWIPL